LSTHVEATPSSAWLLVLNDGQAIAWVLEKSRMAFREGARFADQIRAGDDFVLYCTVTAFGSAGPRGSRVFAYGRFESTIARGSNNINGRKYETQADLVIIRHLLPLEGVDIRLYIDRLDFITTKRAWSSFLRSTVVPLSREDFILFRSEIDKGIGATTSK
jgi:hypothetical protein